MCVCVFFSLQPLNFEGRLKYVDVGGQMRDGGTASQPQLALFAIATPLLPPSVMEIRTKTIVFQTKHKMDFAPTSIDTRYQPKTGVSFFKPDTIQALCLGGTFSQDHRVCLCVPLQREGGPGLFGSRAGD